MQALLEQTLTRELPGQRLKPRQVNGWFTALAKAQRFDLACCVLSALRAVGAEVGAVHYSAAVSGCGKGGKGSWPWDCWRTWTLQRLKRMQSRTVQPSVPAKGPAVATGLGAVDGDGLCEGS